MNPVSTQSLRVQNTSLVLTTILESETPISRATVANRTGLTRATVSRLVTNLIDKNVLVELPPQQAKSGRPSLPLQPSSDAIVAIGMEININYIAVEVIDLAGNVVFQSTSHRNYRKSRPSAAIGELMEMLNTWKNPASAKIVGLTLCVPGLVDQATTTIERAPNLGWNDVEVGSLVSYPGAPEVVLVNEADAGAYSILHTKPGSVSEIDSFLYISGEVGIGAAIVFKGELFTGQNSWAGEIGHMCIDPDGPPCGCGANGCLEQYAGEDALLADTSTARTIPELVDAFLAGDAAARRSVDRASTSLGRAISNVLNLLDLDTVILGGNLGTLLPHMNHILRAEAEYRLISSHAATVDIIADERGNLSAVRGACMMAFEYFVTNTENWL